MHLVQTSVQSPKRPIVRSFGLDSGMCRVQSAIMDELHELSVSQHVSKRPFGTSVFGASEPMQAGQMYFAAAE